MRTIMFIGLLIGLALLLIVVVPSWTSRGGDRLKRSERKELKAHREFQFWLADKTAEHRMLGDHFAEIVSAELTDHRRKIGQ